MNDFNSEIERYKNEMQRMITSRPATPPPPQPQPEPMPEPTPEPTPEPLPPNDNAMGYLQIRAFTADNALPVADAVVLITKGVGENRQLLHRLFTDVSGASATVTLPTADKILSQSPENRKPYSTYDIEVSKEGYIPIFSKDVPVFADVKSVQNFSLIASPEFDLNPAQSVIQNQEPFL